MDFIDSCIIMQDREDGRLDYLLGRIEVDLYLSDIRYSSDTRLKSLTQIDLLIDDPNVELHDPICVSKRTLRSNHNRLTEIKRTVESQLRDLVFGQSYIRRDTIETIKGLINFNQSILRR